MKTVTWLVAVSGLALFAGCSGVEKPGPGDVGHIGFPKWEPADAGDHIEPYGPAPVPLTAAPPPQYKLQRIPARPNVIGKLDVPLKRTWKYIVIHHSYTDSGNEEIFDNHHRKKRGWLGVAYHFVIGNGHPSEDGAIEVTFRWEEQIHGAHAGRKQYNQYGIGICLVGDFERSYPTEKQMAALVSLVSYLQEKCSIPTANIMLHRHIKTTDCPGKNFPFYRFISMLPH